MSSLVINKLYIFTTSEQKAKVINFSIGKNIVTSSKKDGNKRGKSILLKSIYHTLGADCYFDDKWDVQNKIYIVNFSIDQIQYYIYRCDRLFKIFTADYKLLFNTIDRSDLSEFLAKLYGFSVELPSRNNEKLEIAPPVFSYLLNYLDQDKMDGSSFNSFKSLAQYVDFKENLLYSHFGVFDKEYYELVKNIDSLKERERDIGENKDTLEKMLERVSNSIEGSSYSKDIELLQAEVEKSKREYSLIVTKLNATKNSLINLRNEKQKLLMNIDELKQAINRGQTELKNINNHICPLCKSEMTDNLDLRIERYNSVDDLILLSNELEISILQVDKDIEKQEKFYQQTLAILEKYEEKLNFNSGEINDVLKHKGLVEVQNDLIREVAHFNNEFNSIASDIKVQTKKKRIYEQLKKKINNKYCELMMNDKQKFGLKEIDSKHFENIKSVFVAGGSNKPIATVIWLFNLLRLKLQFNPSSIKFPLILDSPNNVELDDEKRKGLFEYLFTNIDKDTQMIVSTLGFDINDYPNIKFNQIIELQNGKYELLNREEYEDNKKILIELSRSTIQ